MNSLLDFSGLPRFSDFTTEDVTPAIDAVLAENRIVVDKVVGATTPTTWQDFVQPVEEAGERLHRGRRANRVAGSRHGAGEEKHRH